MPYSRKPINITTNSTIGEIREELNASITKLNELFNVANELEPAPNPVLHSVTISGGYANNLIHESGELRDAAADNITMENSQINNSQIASTTTSQAALQNNTAVGLSVTNSSMNNSSLNTVTIDKSSIKGYDQELDQTYSVVSHTQGSATVTLTDFTNSLTEKYFWFDGREYFISDSDTATDTITVLSVPADVTFSGNLTIRTGTRTVIWNPNIIEPVYSGVVHMDGDEMNMVIKHRTTAEREALAEGIRYELLYDTDHDALFIFDNNEVGGQPVRAGMYVPVELSLPASGYLGEELYISSEDQFYKFNGTRWNPNAFSGKWVNTTTNLTALVGRKYLVDTTSNQVTIALPTTPETGDEIEIMDLVGNFATNVCNVTSVGHNIEGGALSIVLNSNGEFIRLVYTNAIIGWRIVEHQVDAAAGVTLA